MYLQCERRVSISTTFNVTDETFNVTDESAYDRGAARGTCQKYLSTILHVYYLYTIFQFIHKNLYKFTKATIAISNLFTTISHLNTLDLNRTPLTARYKEMAKSEMFFFSSEFA